MKITISDLETDDASSVWVDRDGIAKEPGGPQGLDVMVDGAQIHFENEYDAVVVAKAILERMGWKVTR